MLGRKNSNSTDMAMELDMMDVEQPLVADTDFPRRSLLREHRTWWSLVAWLGCMGVVAGGLQAVGRPFVDMCLPIESRCDYQGVVVGWGGGRRMCARGWRRKESLGSWRRARLFGGLQGPTSPCTPTHRRALLPTAPRGL